MWIKERLCVSLIMMILTAMILSSCSMGKDGSVIAGEIPVNSSSDAKADEINLVFSGPEQKDLKEVQDAVSKITMKKIHATVKLSSINWGAWSQQTTLMLAGSEKIDLMVTSNTLYDYSNQVTKGQLMPLDDLLKKYGQGILDTLGEEYLSAAKMNGKIYGIPSLRDMAVSYGISMRQDLLDKYHIDPTGIKTLDDVEKVYKMIKENEPGVIPLAAVLGGTTPFEFLYPAYFDLLGDSIGVLPWNSKETKVVDMYETPEYSELVKRARRWFKAGYIDQDASFNKEDAATLIKAGKAFSDLPNLKPGLENQDYQQTGVKTKVIELFPAVRTTSTVSSFMFSIPQSSGNPVKAMELLNLMYTDPEIVNLFHYGIEGKHYVKAADNMIDYPKGVHAFNSGYNLQQGWMFGNSFIAYVWKGNDSNIWQQTLEFNKRAKKSKAYGFVYDSEPVKTEIAAVQNVVSQYKMALETGSVDPEIVLPDFIRQLKTAGIDKVIAEKQMQFDKWLTSQN